jgi:hypothetical protein
LAHGSCLVTYLSGVGVIVSLYACKYLLLFRTCGCLKKPMVFFAGILVSAPVLIFTSCDWDNEQVLPVANFLGNPIILEAVVAIPLWCAFWMWCEISILGWVWL